MAKSRLWIASREMDCAHRCEASGVAWCHVGHIERVVLTCRRKVLEDRWSANLTRIRVRDRGRAKKVGTKKRAERLAEGHRGTMVESLEGSLAVG